LTATLNVKIQWSKPGMVAGSWGSSYWGDWGKTGGVAQAVEGLPSKYDQKQTKSQSKQNSEIVRFLKKTSSELNL
jgi:hypothetical protein